jgi:hypothetical protein
MKNCAVVFLLFVIGVFNAQTQDSLIKNSTSILKRLNSGDSITYYQCHVEEAVQQLSTISGQTLIGKPQKYSITEKYVLRKSAEGYLVNYYSSSFTNFPNRRFSGLKIREKPYWEFKKEKVFTLTNKHLSMLIALENKGREAMEYDYAITKYTTNQLIIKHHKDFKQLVIEGNYVLSKLFGD